MPTRLYARDQKGNRVTIMQATIPKRGKVKIRNAYGFPEEVDVKTLTLMNPDEPGGTLRYGDA